MNDNINEQDIKNELEKNPIPKELEPEEIAKMLEQKSKKKTISHKRNIRIIAMLTACLVLGVGIINLVPYYTNLSTLNNSSEETNSNQDTENNSESLDTNSYYKTADDYKAIYTEMKESYNQNKKDSNNLSDIVGSIFGSKKATNENYALYTDAAEDMATNETGAGNSIATSVSEDYSETLTQVEGVDEADIIKTDGKNIFYTVNNTLYSIPVDNGQINNVSSYPVVSDNGYIQSMYLYNDTVIVIAVDYGDNYGITSYSEGDIMTKDIYPYFSSNSTLVDTYSVNEDGTLTLQTNYSQEGSYSDSRMIDGVIYLTTDYYSYDYSSIEEQENIERYIPSYSVNSETQCISADDILIPNEWSDDSYYNNISYMVIAGVDIKTDASQPVSIMAIAGYSGTSYCSLSNLYITNNTYNDNSSQTDISKFALDNGNITATANGTVEGYVLNQYSMDEYNGNFRIATTSENYSISSSNQDEIFYNSTENRSNNLFVLNENLETIGSVVDFGKTESIKSVSFKGDIGYVVTFEQTDPLFSIDLSDPANPTIISELKADGYSAYLHSWSDGLLLGFGIDTVTIDDEYGSSFVREIGLKLSMFDTADNSNMNELAIYTVSPEDYNQGQVFSEAVYNPKALLLNSQKNIIGFPIIRYYYGDENGSNWQTFSEYHLLTYSDGNFNEIGSISIENTESYEAFSRALYIGDYIYILTNNTVYSANLSDMNVIAEIALS